MSDHGGTLVLVTGASGFIAKHIVLALLKAGYRVRGTVRSADKADGLAATMAQHGADASRLECVETDLLLDAGWDMATAGCRFVIHSASPLPVTLPRDRQALVPAARGGTIRVVEAAKRAGVERIVLTSSAAAISYGHDGRKGAALTEADWSNVESLTISAYAVSKTPAERAAWEAVAGSGTALVSINPSVVLGPLLDADAGASVTLIRMMMRGRLLLVPDIAIGIVDVRNVVAAHLAALDVPDAAGRRFILTAGSRLLREVGAAVAAACPAYAGRMPKATLPDFVLKAAAVFSSAARQVVPELGARRQLVPEPAQTILGVAFRSPDAAIGATARSLVEHGLV